MSLEPAIAERPVVPSPPVSKDILAAVAGEHGITVEAMCSPSRAPRVAWARFDAMQRLYAVTRPDGGRKFSKPMIGRLLGNRDHTTVFHGIKRWETLGGVRPLRRKAALTPGPLRPCGSACLAYVQARFDDGAESVCSSELIGPGMLPGYRARTSVLAALVVRGLVIVQDGVIYPPTAPLMERAA